jgi:hypothetical protein
MEFKSDVNPFDLQHLQPATWILLTAVKLYCHNEKLPLVITSLISDRQGIGLKTVSKTHDSGRAFDIRSRNWTQEDVDRFVAYFNTHYYDIGALSYKDKKVRVAKHHNNHIHLQVRPNADVSKFI